MFFFQYNRCKDDVRWVFLNVLVIGWKGIVGMEDNENRQEWKLIWSLKGRVWVCAGEGVFGKCLGEVGKEVVEDGNYR